MKFNIGDKVHLSSEPTSQWKDLIIIKAVTSSAILTGSGYICEAYAGNMIGQRGFFSEDELSAGWRVQPSPVVPFISLEPFEIRGEGLSDEDVKGVHEAMTDYNVAIGRTSRVRPAKQCECGSGNDTAGPGHSGWCRLWEKM